MNPTQAIKDLREKTGVSIAVCRKALEQAGGNIEKALLILKKEGDRVAEKKSEREVKEGIVEAYVHNTKKVGVLVEVRCETDFVAKNEAFKAFAHDIAMHIAAFSPSFLSRETVPEHIVGEMRAIFEEEAGAFGKEKEIVKKIAEGKLGSYFKEHVLIEQPFIKNQDITVGEYVKEGIQKFGENIKVRRFVRFEL